MRLIGKATGTIDLKSRVSLPATYRKQLPAELVITKSPDIDFPSLVIFTPDGFDGWINNVMEGRGGYRASSRNLDDIVEMYHENAFNLKVDGVGRILIPTELREYARIEKDMVFSGRRDRLIVRSAEIWEAKQKHMETVTAYDDEPAQA